MGRCRRCHRLGRLTRCVNDIDSELFLPASLEVWCLPITECGSTLNGYTLFPLQVHTVHLCTNSIASTNLMRAVFEINDSVDTSGQPVEWDGITMDIPHGYLEFVQYNTKYVPSTSSFQSRCEQKHQCYAGASTGRHPAQSEYAAGPWDLP